MTSAQVRRALEKNAAERTRLEAALDANIRERLLLDQIARLHSEHGGSRISGKMHVENAAGKERRIKIAASSTQHESDSKRLLIEADKSDGDIAAELGVGRSTVRAWHAGERPIPRKYAAELLKTYGVPLSAWPKILG